MLPPATVDGHEASVEATGDAVIGTIANASGGVLAGLAGGWATDHRTGNRTYFLSGSVGGARGRVGQGQQGRASVAGSDSDRYALTVAPDGRWIDLAVTRTGELGTSVDLPKDVAAALGTLDLPGSPPRRWVTDSHLDLGDPQNLAAAQAFVAGLRDPLHPRPADGRDRRAVAADAGRRGHRRAHLRGRHETRGAEGRVGAGAQIGGKYQTSTEQSARLVAATTRGLDGQWRVRDDCLEEATT